MSDQLKLNEQQIDHIRKFYKKMRISKDSQEFSQDYINAWNRMQDHQLLSLLQHFDCQTIEDEIVGVLKGFNN